MKNIEAKERLADGQRIDIVKQAYIEDKIKAVNYGTKDGKKHIVFHDVRKDTEKPYIEAKALLDWQYYVVNEITQEEHQKLSNEVDEQMQIAVYDENEKQGNKYPKLKQAMASKIDKLKEKHEVK